MAEKKKKTVILDTPLKEADGSITAPGEEVELSEQDAIDLVKMKAAHWPKAKAEKPANK